MSTLANVGKWLVVSIDCSSSAVQVAAPLHAGAVDGEELLVVSGVILLGRVELLAIKSNGVQLALGSSRL